MDYTELSFEDDILNRKRFINNLMGVIDDWNNYEHENKSMSIAINAQWGAGKSYLLNLWKNSLLNSKFGKRNSAVVYYDAWKNDDFENAFLPFLYELTNVNVGIENKEICDIVKSKAIELAKQYGIALVKKQLEKIIDKDDVKALYDIYKGVDSKKTENVFAKFKKYIEMKEDFSESLRELIPDDGKLYIFIDELDRCKPQFAIDTLEIIKHFCNIPNIIFIYAVDLKQLSFSIQTYYGQGMDSSGYLRRFFDYNVNLPNIKIKDYIEQSLESISAILDERKDFDRHDVENMFLKLNLSLRDINKICDNIMVFCSFYKDRILKAQNIENLNTYIYFIILKYKYPEKYNMILDDYGYMLSDNTPKNWPIIENYYFTGMKIASLISEGQASALSNERKFIDKYCLSCLNYNKVNFNQHIKDVLELI